MKILQINNHHRKAGGAHMVYFRTADLLKKKGHDVYFFSLKEEDSLEYEYTDLFPDNIDYRKLGSIQKAKSAYNFLYNKEAYKKLDKYIKLIKPDIAHVHLFMGGLTVSVLDALKKNGIPIVHTVHDYRLICPAYLFLDRNNKICERCRDGFFLRCGYKRCSLDNKYADSFMLSLDAYFRKYINNPLKQIDSFIFVSKFSKDLHCSFNQLYEKKGSLLYNFLEQNCNNAPFKGEYFLFYGRLSREKGIINLIQVMQKLGFNLKIAGSGPLSEYINTVNDQNIDFVGYKSGEELINLILNASFVIVPSEWYENNPLTIVESFSYGKPVIGSSIGGIPELIQNRRGFLFEAGDNISLENAILEANSISEDVYSQMSKEVTNFANQEFSEEFHYTELMKIYTGIYNKEIS